MGEGQASLLNLICHRGVAFCGALPPLVAKLTRALVGLLPIIIMVVTPGYSIQRLITTVRIYIVQVAFCTVVACMQKLGNNYYNYIVCLGTCTRMTVFTSTLDQAYHSSATHHPDTLQLARNTTTRFLSLFCMIKVSANSLTKTLYMPVDLHPKMLYHMDQCAQIHTPMCTPWPVT